MITPRAAAPAIVAAFLVAFGVALIRGPEAPSMANDAPAARAAEDATPGAVPRLTAGRAPALPPAVAARSERRRPAPAAGASTPAPRPAPTATPPAPPVLAGTFEDSRGPSRRLGPGGSP